MTGWSYMEHPLISLGDNEQWYLVGSPERAVGYVRNEEDAKLIAHAPEMYELLKSEFSHRAFFTTSHEHLAVTEEHMTNVKMLLARIDGKEAEHD